ncbi:hypothetical protein GGR57DRAFT_494855 [Xylariaceae sp. FL1272]|nr:hypothetical protein GGR57DRAFT_494855 [Xylariaceae sp. FL1272]
MYNQGKIIKRLLGREIANDNNGIPSSNAPNPQIYRPNASQNAVYPSPVPIACIDRSEDGHVAVLGGRHVLKTIQIDGLEIKEGVDVRAAITAQFASKGSVASLASDQLSIKDVKIGTNNSAEIFTACANGKIFMYNLNRLTPNSSNGLECVQTWEGSRQVNKLDINPHRKTLMLSGGQDGIVRCLDIQDPVQSRNGLTFRTRQAFRCNSDAIRDIKWSPKDGVIFACGTESGAIMKWDVRNPRSPLLKINAHDPQKGVTSISWHPDGNHLISSGLDGKCSVWDLSTKAEKRQKPKWTINAPAPVTCVSWRPGLWSATAQGRRAAQVAVAYDEGSQLKKNGISSVHIWDLARPTMPYKEIQMFDNSPYNLLWHDQDLLWAVGQDGFTQCDVAFAPKVVDRQPLSSLDFSARGEVLMFLEERHQTPRPRSAIRASDLLPTASYSSSPTGQTLSLSRSDSEEDVIGSFLGPKRRSSSRRKNGTQQTQSLSTTPPSGHGLEKETIGLETAIKLTNPFRPQQVMAIGRVPAATKVDTYQFFSQQYLEILERGLPIPESSPETAEPLDKRVLEIMDQYARAAESVSQFRLAQTWRILSFAMNMLLQSRSKYHLERRLTRPEKKKSSVKVDNERPVPQRVNSSVRLGVDGADTPRKAPSVTSIESRPTHTRSLLAEEIDSESNLATPLARPVQEYPVDFDGVNTEKRLTPVTEAESFSLGPAIHSAIQSPRRRLDSAPLSVISQESQISSTEGYDFYDMDAVEELPAATAIDVPQRREPLRIEPTEPRSPNSHRRKASRHDSDDSFPPIFPLSEASRQTSILTSSSTGSSQPLLRRQQQQSSGSYEYEYGSRIRGKQISESPEHRRLPGPPALERHGSSNLTADYMTSQTTSDTLSSDPPESESAYTSAKLKETPPAKQSNTPKPSKESMRPEDHDSPTITETDYLPWDDDPDYPYPISSNPPPRETSPPINPYQMLARAFAFETKRSPLNASAMILLLKPLVPDDVIDDHQAAAVLRQHHSRLMNMRLVVEAALLRNLCVRGWPSGLDIWGENYPSIFRPAQDRVAVGFACATCHKPREIVRTSPDSSGIWKCERCRALVAPCAICGHREPALDAQSASTVGDGLTQASTSPDDAFLTTWWYCPGCAHGGHASCLQEWHGPITAPPLVDHSKMTDSTSIYSDLSPETNSDGCCPADGCGHACLPGRWRNESTTARTEELGRAMREQYRGIVTGLQKADAKPRASVDASVNSTPAGSVRGDGLEVPQSRAVESVREALGGNERDARSSGGLMGILSSSPGRSSGFGIATGERERRKSVKFAGPAEDRR